MLWLRVVVGAEQKMWYIFCSVSSLDNGTEGGVAKHPTPLFSFKRSVRRNLLGKRNGAGLSRRGLILFLSAVPMGSLAASSSPFRQNRSNLT